jgi:hypothetical protein
VLAEEPKHHWLVTPFSMSPEHGYYDAKGRMAFLSPAPTMDVAILRELFPHCIEASKLLDVDEQFRAKLEAALGRLPPYQINGRGHLQEWMEDWKPGPQGHNVSPNFAFYPGSSIILRRDPKLAAAIARWMEKRRAGGDWPRAWDLCVWARLERGNKVGAGMQAFVRQSPASNLHNRGANQSDATFGFTAAVAEALVQSHAGEISLLPALPVHWTEGSVTGLRARGGFEVDIHWKNGKLQAAEIRTPGATACKVRYGTKTAEFSLKPGQALRLNADLMAKTDPAEAKSPLSARKENHNMRNKLTSVALGLVLAAPTFAADGDGPASAEVTAAMKPYLDSYQLAGVIAIVADKTGIVHYQNFLGYADVEAKKPIREDNVFWIASMTKMFAGASILMLVDEAKVSLDDPVTRFIPQVNNWMVVEEKDSSHMLLKPLVRPVTIRHLLSHTSRLAGVSKLQRVLGADRSPLKARALSSVTGPLQGQPGDQYAYGNQGMNIAARIVGIVSGMPYEQFLQKRLFDP